MEKVSEGKYCKIGSNVFKHSKVKLLYFSFENYNLPRKYTSMCGALHHSIIEQFMLQDIIV